MARRSACGSSTSESDCRPTPPSSSSRNDHTAQGVGGAQDWWALTLAMPAGVAPGVQAGGHRQLRHEACRGSAQSAHRQPPVRSRLRLQGLRLFDATGRSSVPMYLVGRSATCRSTVPCWAGGWCRRSTFLLATRQIRASVSRSVIVHDGPDYLRYAAASTVLDNLVHGGVIPPPVVAFVHAGERFVEYADDVRHHQHLTTELLPHLETELATGGEPASGVLAGASFGAVASLSAAVYEQTYKWTLLLQSVVAACRRLLAAPRGAVATDQAIHPVLSRHPTAVTERIYVTCGVLESLICENHGLVPVLASTGMNVTFDESLDGHNWASWRGPGSGRHCPRCSASRTWLTSRAASGSRWAPTCVARSLRGSASPPRPRPADRR